MYQVLVYVYENYGGGAETPDRHRLGMRLSSAGFERDEIQQALHWLDGLDSAAHAICIAPKHDVPHAAAPVWAASPDSLRIYSPLEMAHLGREGIACLKFLEDAGALSAELREVVIDRALAASESPIDLEDLKIIIMMVYWRVDANPGLLVLDELSDDTRHRIAH
ncbi:DUF494 family protein [Ottowia testudinis]|uniref:Protein Smg homolog n=1 Tax=Ottowia testudinis TaxID=2816950 RepID=A0A975CFT9_9BURK|nr:DUF494 domain-containing protein [Ottowia testudinis]QTD45620.1 DUF494 domain-containing protein [Ottowia testudinis]